MGRETAKSRGILINGRRALVRPRYRVIAPATQRPAPQDAFESKPTTLKEPILLDRFRCVLGATGIEPAHRRQIGGNGQLVQPNRGQCREFHCCGSAPISRVRLRRSCAARSSLPYSASPDPRRAMRMASHPGSHPANRTTSLSRRLRRFLDTALPTRLLATKQKRDRSISFAETRRTKRRLAMLRPFWWISEMRAFPVSR